MSETQTHQPGKHEAEALVMMNEVERPTARPRRHIVVHQEGPGAFRAYAWIDEAGRWEHAGLGDGAIRAHAIDFLAERVRFDNVTMTDEHIEFAEFDGFGPDEFDDCAFNPRHDRSVLCPEGVPKMPDEWNSVHLGVGTVALADIRRFPKIRLIERFRNAAAAPEQRLRDHVPKGPTVLVRHDAAARDLVSQEKWGITGRPDLLGRQVDEELRRRQEQTEQDAIEWQSPTGRANIVARQKIERQKAKDRIRTLPESARAGG